MGDENFHGWEPDREEKLMGLRHFLERAAKFDRKIL